MTKVTFCKQGDMFIGFNLEGHACFNPGGPDILCSAISMASQMTTLGLSEVAKVQVNETTDDGFYSVNLIEGWDSKEAQILMMTFYLAMMNLYEQYPDFISISRAGWCEK